MWRKFSELKDFRRREERAELWPTSGIQYGRLDTTIHRSKGRNSEPVAWLKVARRKPEDPCPGPIEEGSEL